ncbi:MAG: hypothetical protein ACFCU1_09085 [Sumerlaeia bacterium]
MKAINKLFRNISRVTRRAFLGSLTITSFILFILILSGAGTLLFGYHVLDVVYSEEEVTAVIVKPREPKPVPTIYVPPAKIEFPIY